MVLLNIGRAKVLIMSATSIGRMALPFVAIVAGCGVALVFDVTHLRREPAPETSAPTAASTPPRPASNERDEGLAARAVADTKAAVADGRTASPRSPAAAEAVPVFDIARVEQTGEAVIAGRAASGAAVDLLRNGERLDGAVADSSGQFAMIIPRLPPGSYELTLSARSPDGTLATSKQGVAVELEEAWSSSSSAPSRAKERLNVAEIPKVKGLSEDVRSSQARLLSRPPLQVTKREAYSQPPQALAAASPSDEASSSPGGAPRTLTRVVSRGDSLWRISRVAYGVGEQYVVVYKANRDRIRNPNLIYPGQTFVLPIQAHELHR